jgi:membrane protein insertase Oxa1/YidC/SpoIIIJ
MEIFYYLVFGVLGLVVAALELSKNNKDRINTSSAFNSFKNNYLLVYSLMMGTMAFPSLFIFPFVCLVMSVKTYLYPVSIRSGCWEDVVN